MNKFNLRSSVLVFLCIVCVLSGRLSPASNTKGETTDLGPHVVVLRELEDQYEPVPFDHLSHAKMAEMWNGCVTCHHHSPLDDTLSTDTLHLDTTSQDEAGKFPACKTCHAVSSIEADIRKPSLKGAYHRQCLNCHQEWMNENACVVCHAAKQEGVPLQYDPSPDDIVGRMHPPIPEPDVVQYKTRFTPVDGNNVVFRHQEHSLDFGIRCSSCHRRDNCTNCHRPGEAPATKPLRPGMTWNESHGPCIVCHQQERCQHCHYKDNEQAPSAFDHRNTGMVLDNDHVTITCANCHAGFDFLAQPTCGDASCHKDAVIEYPVQLPGIVMLPETDTTATAELSAGGR